MRNHSDHGWNSIVRVSEALMAAAAATGVALFAALILGLL